MMLVADISCLFSCISYINCLKATSDSESGSEISSDEHDSDTDDATDGEEEESATGGDTQPSNTDTVHSNPENTAVDHISERSNNIELSDATSNSNSQEQIAGAHIFDNVSASSVVQSDCKASSASDNEHTNVHNNPDLLNGEELLELFKSVHREPKESVTTVGLVCIILSSFTVLYSVHVLSALVRFTCCIIKSIFVKNCIFINY